MGSIETGRPSAGVSLAYVDPRSGSTYPLTTPRWKSELGGPLMLSPLDGIDRSQIDYTERSLWRYRAALPVFVKHPVSLGEGCTPLVERTWQGAAVLFKLEWFSPTGSFKDRGASVMISILREQGIRHVLEDSSGNGGAAIAAYAAAAGLQAKILAPASTDSSKTVQMRAYGAEVELVAGTREETAEEASRQATQLFYAGHNWQPFFLQGTKTLAYELWEDLGFREPDNIIIPTGAGSNVLGCDIGFGELLRRGEVTRLPRIFAVQPERCAPIHASFAAEVEEPVAIRALPTIAEGTAIVRPVRLREVLEAIRRSGGATVTVTEEEIVAGLRELATAHGLHAEPTSAAAAAALTKLIAVGTIRRGETTVVLLTGSGLKAAQSIGALLGSTR